MVNHAKEIEDSILGACLTDRFALEDVKERLTPECFYNDWNRFIYKAILECEQPDILSVEERLKDMGKFNEIGSVYIADLTREASMNVEYHCQILIEKKIKRDVVDLCQNIQSKAMNGVDTYDMLDDLNRAVDGLDKGIKSKESLTPSQIFEREENKPKAEKLYIGLSQLDNGIYADTMHKGQVELTIADSGHGKTHYAMYKAQALLKRGYKIGWFQLEDYDVHTAKYMATHAPEQMDNIHICHSLYDIEDIKRECRIMKKEYGIDYIVFDYVQNIECNLNLSRTEKVEYISKQITKMAKDLEVFCHVLSQVTVGYQSRSGWSQEPSYGDVRWSQQLKQDAHIITSVFRPSKVESLVISTDSVKDWKENSIPYDSVFVKQAKVRHGKQYWNRLHLIHQDDGLKPYINENKVPF